MIITLKNALELMEKMEGFNQVPFDIEYCSFSKSRGTGGEIISLKGVTLNKLKSDEKMSPAIQTKIAVRSERQPAHFQNKTRNVTLPNAEIRKLHIRFILKINGLTVVY